jgi:hypothetical protein
VDEVKEVAVAATVKFGKAEDESINHVKGGACPSARLKFHYLAYLELWTPWLHSSISTGRTSLLYGIEITSRSGRIKSRDLLYYKSWYSP